VFNSRVRDNNALTALSYPALLAVGGSFDLLNNLVLQSTDFLRLFNVSSYL
jgi:hypothetical protein